MKFVIHYLLICVVLLGILGCAPKGAKLQKSVTPPDKTLYVTGTDYLKHGHFIKSRLAFQTLINTYSDSEYAAEAFFAMGDSFYDEGGAENLLNAEEQYSNFIIFFPANPKVAEAMMKNISLSVKMMHAPGRDQSNSYRALKHINNFLEKFPNHDFTPLVKIYKTQVEENIALGDFGVAQFYADMGNVIATHNRLKTIMDNYPDFSRMDEVFFIFADGAKLIKNPEEEAIYLSKVATGYPYSKYFETAKQRLAGLNKPIPAVDEKLSALHKSRVKEESFFNPLKVFVGIGKEMGFIQPPDIYKQMKKTIAEENVKKAEEAAEKAEEGSGSEIQAVIKKSATGETSETYVLGQESNVSQPNDSPAKKKTVIKNKRQSIKKPE